MTLLARASAGLLLWAFGFSLLYSLQGIACGGGWNDGAPMGGTVLGVTPARWVLMATWMLLLAGALALVRMAWGWRGSSVFERRLFRTSALVGLGAIFVTGAPVAIASTCL